MSGSAFSVLRVSTVEIVGEPRDLVDIDQASISGRFHIV
jgi:hypothetical protein